MNALGAQSWLSGSPPPRVRASRIRNDSPLVPPAALRMVKQAVDQGDGGGLVGQEAAPLVEGVMAGHAQAAALVGGGHQAKEQLPAGGVEWRRDLLPCGRRRSAPRTPPTASRPAPCPRRAPAVDQGDRQLARVAMKQGRGPRPGGGGAVTSQASAGAGVTAAVPAVPLRTSQNPQIASPAASATTPIVPTQPGSANPIA